MASNFGHIDEVTDKKDIIGSVQDATSYVLDLVENFDNFVDEVEKAKSSYNEPGKSYVDLPNIKEMENWRKGSGSPSALLLPNINCPKVLGGYYFDYIFGRVPDCDTSETRLMEAVHEHQKRRDAFKRAVARWYSPKKRQRRNWTEAKKYMQEMIQNKASESKKPTATSAVNLPCTVDKLDSPALRKISDPDLRTMGSRSSGTVTNAIQSESHIEKPVVKSEVKSTSSSLLRSSGTSAASGREENVPKRGEAKRGATRAPRC